MHKLTSTPASIITLLPTVTGPRAQTIMCASCDRNCRKPIQCCLRQFCPKLGWSHGRGYGTRSYRMTVCEVPCLSQTHERWIVCVLSASTFWREEAQNLRHRVHNLPSAERLASQHLRRGTHSNKNWPIACYLKPNGRQLHQKLRGL